MGRMISDRLMDAIDKKQNPCAVGLDPVIERIPKHLIGGDTFKDTAEAFRRFNFEIIDAIADIIPIVKPQVAFYEKYKHYGFKAFEDTVDYAKSKGMVVIEDGKRNDIGNTAKAYADGHLGKVRTLLSESRSLDLDMLTVNPYFGSDGISPFVDVCRQYNKGIFVLVKTSNPGSGEIQDRIVEITDDELSEFSKLGVNLSSNKTNLYNLVGLQVNRFAQKLKGRRGYSPIGAVIGATYPSQAEILRMIMPDSIFLVPGYGAQGGAGKDITNCFNLDGYGAVISSSRGIIFAYEKSGSQVNFADASRKAAEIMIDDICTALYGSNKMPLAWK